MQRQINLQSDTTNPNVNMASMTSPNGRCLTPPIMQHMPTTLSTTSTEGPTVSVMADGGGGGEDGEECCRNGGGGSMAEECVGCRRPITERYLLKVMEQSWHEDCLKCSCCDCRLGEVGSTLFTRANLMLCRRDYLRWVIRSSVTRFIESQVSYTLKCDSIFRIAGELRSSVTQFFRIACRWVTLKCDSISRIAGELRSSVTQFLESQVIYTQVWLEFLESQVSYTQVWLEFSMAYVLLNLAGENKLPLWSGCCRRCAYSHPMLEICIDGYKRSGPCVARFPLMHVQPLYMHSLPANSITVTACWLESEMD